VEETVGVALAASAAAAVEGKIDSLFSPDSW